MSVNPAEWLDDEGKAIWRTLAPALVDGTLDRLGHYENFTMMCDAWSTYKRLSVATRGMECVERTAPSGNRIEVNPAVKVMEAAHARFVAHSTAFGLNPLAFEKLRRAALNGDRVPEGIEL